MNSRTKLKLLLIVILLGFPFVWTLEGCSKKSNQVQPSNGVESTTAATSKSVSVAPGARTATSPSAAIDSGSRLTGPSNAVSKVETTQPKPKEDRCFKAVFKHKEIASHTDDEACSHHRNIISIKNENINSKSICVRVDGTPVNFQLNKDTKTSLKLLFGPIAGPKATIAVTYCTGKAVCKTDCKIAKDEFMEAIGANAEQDQKPNGRAPAHSASWDPSENNAESDVTKEIDSEVMKELADDSDLAVFEGWLSQEPQETSCRS